MSLMGNRFRSTMHSPTLPDPRRFGKTMSALVARDHSRWVKFRRTQVHVGANPLVFARLAIQWAAALSQPHHLTPVPPRFPRSGPSRPVRRAQTNGSRRGARGEERSRSSTAETCPAPAIMVNTEATAAKLRSSGSSGSTMQSASAARPGPSRRHRSSAACTSNSWGL
jgi:hypothetical protein